MGDFLKKAYDNDMKCPFCQQELHKDSDGYYTCYTDNCGCWANGGNGASGSESLWLTLIRTRKALDVAVDALKDNLSQANFTQMLDASRFHCIRTKCEFALEQIKELEQKDK